MPMSVTVPVRWVVRTAAPEMMAEQGLQMFTKYGGSLTPAQQASVDEWKAELQRVEPADGTANIVFVPGVDRETVEIVATCLGLASDAASVFIDINPGE